MRAIIPFAGAPSAKGGSSPNAKCENRWDDRVCEGKRRHGLCKQNPRKSHQWNLKSKEVMSVCKKACGLPPCPKRAQQPKRQSQGCNSIDILDSRNPRSICRPIPYPVPS